MPEDDRWFGTARRPWPCSAPKCSEQRTVWCTYDYVTGRRGRVSSAQRGYCDSHAEKFAKKHRIEIEGEQERPRHASELAFAQAVASLEVEVVTGAQFRRLLDGVYDKTPRHVMGQERPLVEAALAQGKLQDGWSVTFYDDGDQQDGNSAYCLGWIREGAIAVTHKTYGRLNEDLH